MKAKFIYFDFMSAEWVKDIKPGTRADDYRLHSNIAPKGIMIEKWLLDNGSYLEIAFDKNEKYPADYRIMVAEDYNALLKELVGIHHDQDEFEEEYGEIYKQLYDKI